MERDSIEVIQHLKREIITAQKESQLVTEQMKEVGLCINDAIAVSSLWWEQFKKQSRHERDGIVDDYTQQIALLEDRIQGVIRVF